MYSFKFTLTYLNLVKFINGQIRYKLPRKDDVLIKNLLYCWQIYDNDYKFDKISNDKILCYRIYISLINIII